MHVLGLRLIEHYTTNSNRASGNVARNIHACYICCTTAFTLSRPTFAFTTTAFAVASQFFPKLCQRLNPYERFRNECIRNELPFKLEQSRVVVVGATTTTLSEIVALGISVNKRQLTFLKTVFSRSIRDHFIRTHAVAIRNYDDDIRRRIYISSSYTGSYHELHTI